MLEDVIPSFKNITFRREFTINIQLSNVILSLFRSLKTTRTNLLSYQKNMKTKCLIKFVSGCCWMNGGWVTNNFCVLWSRIKKRAEILSLSNSLSWASFIWLIDLIETYVFRVMIERLSWVYNFLLWIILISEDSILRSWQKRRWYDNDNKGAVGDKEIRYGAISSEYSLWWIEFWQIADWIGLPIHKVDFS